MNLSLIRLALLGSRGHLGRHLAIGGGIAFGTALLVMLVGVSLALKQRDERGGWLYSGILMPKVSGIKGLAALEPVQTTGSVLIGESFDIFKQKTIMVIHVSAPPETYIEVPGVSRPPRPGEFFVSPALGRLMASVPPDELARRFPGRQVGVVDPSLLNSADSLVIVEGETASTVKSDQFFSILPSSNSQKTRPSLYSMKRGIATGFLRGFLNIVGIALTFPVIVLIGTFSRLGAAARNERYATLRLVGATPLQIGYIAGIETAVVGAFGSVVGAVLAEAILPLFAKISIAGLHVLSSDIRVDPGSLTVVVLVMTLVSTVSTIIGVLMLGIPPLGYNRRIAERKPTVRRLLPLGIGLALLLSGRAILEFSKGSTRIGPLLMLAGFPICIAGVLSAGPWLTYLFSRVMSRCVQSPAGLIAASRICSTPGAVFRAASGLVVIVFLVSYIYGCIACVDGNEPAASASQSLPDNVVLAKIGTTQEDLQNAPQLVSELKRVPGVLQAAATYSVPGSSDKMEIIPALDAAALGLPALPNTPIYETFDAESYLKDGAHGFSPRAVQINPNLQKLKPQQVIAVTDGQADAMERARTMLDGADIVNETRSSDDQLIDLAAKFLREVHLLANLVIAFIILISGCSLAVAAMVGMIDRRRAFGLLRLVGMPVSELKTVVMIEALVPMLAVTLFSALSGFLVAGLDMSAILRLHIGALPTEYFGTIGVGLAAAIVVMVCTAQMVGKTTSSTSTRFE